MGKLLAASLKLRIGITLLGKGLQVIHHGVPHSIGESRFFSIKDIVREIIPFKSMAQQVLSLAIDVHFLGGVNGEDIAAVCKANGVSDAKTIQDIIAGAECDLRRVKRAVWAAKKKGGAQ